ncbi:MAG: amylo-alpha-1,6-glucosidase [Anaerolineales bacterium]
MSTPSYIDLMKNRIDISRVPFSDRGSRLLVYRSPQESRLIVKLAERLTRLQPEIDAYRQRGPFISDLRFVDSEGDPLDFEVESYPHALTFHTRIGDFGMVFEDDNTLAIGLPANQPAGLRFHVSPQFWEESPHGGVFKAIRNLTYTTNQDEVLCNEIRPKEGGYAVAFIVAGGEDVAVHITVSDMPVVATTLRPYSRSYVDAEQRWQRWYERVPPVSEHYRSTYAYAWWIMANNLVSPQGQVGYEAMMPSKMAYVGLWLWDSAMHALAYRHLDADLARNQLRAMIAHQLPDGMLPDAIYDEAVISEISHPIRAEVTKPPILAWAALKLHETDPDISFLQEIYVPLVRWNAWWFAMNDDDVDGLVQYNHPYSSGLDDSPLWDYGMPVESPDLNTYLCVQMGSLALMAEMLGMEAEGGMWRRRAAALVGRMIQDFWDPHAGVFKALHNEEPVPVLTPFNLYPLWTGQLPDDLRERLIAHLTNPDEFWNEYVLPTVARNDPHFAPATMWRGPVWVNINYFFIEALHQVERHDLARELRRKTLELVMAQSSIYEYYHAQTGEPPATAADIFGWTAAVFIDLAIQASREEGIDEQAESPGVSTTTRSG